MYGVGDQVVCINDNEPPQGEGPRVVLNEVYTVIRMEHRMKPVGFVAPGILLAQPVWYVHLAEVPSPRGVGFYAFRFRKVDKKSTTSGIKILNEIKDGTRQPGGDEGPVRAPVKIPEKVE